MNSNINLLTPFRNFVGWFLDALDRCNEPACLALAFAAILSIIGLAMAVRLQRRPAARHSFLLATVVCIAFLPMAIFLGELSGVRFAIRNSFARTNDSALAVPIPSTQLEVSNPNSVKTRPKHDLTLATVNAKKPDVARQDDLRNRDEIAELTIATTQAVSVEEMPPAACHLRQATSWQVSRICWLLYSAVSVLLSIPLLRACFQISRIRRECSTVSNESLLCAIDNASKQLGLVCVPRLATSDLVGVPMVIGLRRPVIVVPSLMLTQLDCQPDCASALLRHELAHVARRDNFIILLQSFLCVAYWPVVPVHWLCRRLRLTQEELCDQIAAGKDPIGYGRSLLAIAESVHGHRQPLPLCSASLGNRKDDLDYRVRALIEEDRDRNVIISRRLRWCILTLGIAILAACGVLRWSTVSLAVQPPLHHDADDELREPLDQVALADIGPSALRASSTPFYRRPLAPTVWLKKPLAFPPSASPQFSGQVVDTDGNPIADAKLFVIPLSIRSSHLNSHATASTSFRLPSLHRPETLSPGPVRGVSDSNGNFAFDAADLLVIAADGQPALPRVKIYAVADGFGPDAVVIDQGHSISLRPFTLTLAVDDMPIEGRVVNQQGDPMAGIHVRVARIEIPHDFSEHLDRLRTLMPSSMGPSPRATISGLFEFPNTQWETLSDQNGKFTLRGVGRDRFVTVSAYGERMADSTLSVITRPQDQWPELSEPFRKLMQQREEANLDTTGVWSSFARDRRPVLLGPDEGSLQMLPAPLIEGTVVDSITGKPVAGITVGAKACRNPENSNSNVPDHIGSIRAISDSEGRFRFTLSSGMFDAATHIAVPTGDTPTGTHLGSVSVFKRPEGDADLTGIMVPVDRGVAYVVKLHDDRGKVIEDAEIFAVATNRHTMPAEEIEPGVYRGLATTVNSVVRINAPDDVNYVSAYINDPPSQSLQVLYDAIVPLSSALAGPADAYTRASANPIAPIELDVQLTRADPLTLRAIDEAGNLVRDVETRGLDLSSAPTDPVIRDGTVSICSLHPQRSHTIRFEHPSRGIAGQINVDGSMTGPIDVVLRPTAKITGKVVDTSGNPVQRSIKLKLNYERSNNNVSSWRLGGYTTVKQGEFMFEHVIAEFPLRITVVKEGSFPEQKPIVAKSGETIDVGELTLSVD